eukprot:SAG31_NODE_1594_length_7791_cov_2.912192_3_plen_504_part_00
MRHSYMTAMLADWQDYESSIPGMYVAGTLGHYRDWRKSSGGFVHGFRYTVRALHRWLEQAHESTAWPSFLVKTNPEKIAKQILGRLSEASGIYQMFGELGELVVVTPKGSRYFEEVPVKLLPQMLATVGLPKSLDRLQFYTVVLEYGRCFKEEAVILRNRYCGSASCYLQTNQIHPVIRYYDYPASALSGGQIDVTKPLREFHLTEDLNTRWLDKDRFLVPAMTFLARTLGMAADDSSNIPLLIAERDVHAPLPSCELERVGQLLHDKYEKLFATDPVLARFMLLQAVKFKPVSLLNRIGTRRNSVASPDCRGICAATSNTPHAYCQDLAQKHWDDTARATLTGLLQAQPVDSTLAACRYFLFTFLGCGLVFLLWFCTIIDTENVLAQHRGTSGGRVRGCCSSYCKLRRAGEICAVSISEFCPTRSSTVIEGSCHVGLMVWKILEFIQMLPNRSGRRRNHCAAGSLVTIPTATVRLAARFSLNRASSFGCLRRMFLLQVLEGR